MQGRRFWERCFALFQLLRIAVMREFLDVVDQAVELPLGIDLLSASEREAVQALVVADIAKDRFHRGKALAVLLPACFTVDGAFHPLGVAFFCRVSLALVESDLTHFGFLGRTQAFRTVITGQAITLATAELGKAAPVDRAVRPVLVELFACRANAATGLWVVLEISGAIALAGFFGCALSYSGSGLALCRA